MKKKVKEVMREDIEFISPDATLAEAAKKMKQTECGILPVGDKNSIEGIITDRDIVVRAISEGKDPAKEKVSDHMTTDVCYCGDTDIVSDAARMMHDNNVSRLVVKDNTGKLRGILTFGSILRKHDDQMEVVEIVASATGHMAA